MSLPSGRPKTAVISPLGGYPQSPNLGFHEYASQLAEAGQHALRIDCNRLFFRRELRFLPEETSEQALSLSPRERVGVREHNARTALPHPSPLPLAGEGTLRSVSSEGFAQLTYDPHFAESALGVRFIEHVRSRLAPHFTLSPHLLLDFTQPVATPEQAIALLTARPSPPALLELEASLRRIKALREVEQVHLSVSLPSQIFWALDLAVRLRTLLPSAAIRVGGSQWEFFLHHPDARRLLDLVHSTVGLDLSPPPSSPAPTHAPPPPPLRRVPRYPGARRHGSLAFQTQTGCAYGRCTFCYFPLVTGQEQASASLKERQLRFVVRKYRPERLFISDAFIPAVQLQRVLRGIPAGGVRGGVACFVRFERRFSDPRFLGELRQAGLRKVFIGLESGSPRVLRKMDKGIDLAVASSNLVGFAAAGIDVQLSVIVGFPTETQAEAEETLAYLEHHRAQLSSRPQIFRFTLDPMTPIHAEPQAYGITEVKAPASLFYPVFGVETDAGMTRVEADAMAERFEKVLDGLYGARQVDRTNTLGGQAIVVEGKLE